MKSYFNSFVGSDQRKLSLIDFFRYSLANLTSFGTIMVFPVTPGAKLVVVSEHLLGMLYMFGLMGGLIGFLVS